MARAVYFRGRNANPRVRPRTVKKRRYTRRIGLPRTIVPYNSYGVLGASVKKFHKYRDVFALNPGAVGTIASKAWTANGLFDPEVAVGGHQPMGFDEMAALYNHYTVVGCTMQLTMVNQAGANLTLAVNVFPSSSAPANMQDMVELPGTSWTVVQTDNASGAGKSMGKLRKKCNLSKYFSKTRSQLINSSLYRGSATANPTEQAYFIISANSFNQSEDPGSFSIQVVLTYETIWTEPVRITGS